MPDLFELQKQNKNIKRTYPLAVRMRPQSLNEFIGQEHMLGKGKLLRRAIDADRITSLILYGPPGTGKTALAHVIANITKAYFYEINAVISNVQELRDAIKASKKQEQATGRKTILFIDEIHRFNKAQQDVLMPDVESGNPILIGATTHNPFFSLVSPLISRSIVFELKKLSKEDIVTILKNALKEKDRGLGKMPIKIDEKTLCFLADSSDGDARKALNALEVGALTTKVNKDDVIDFDIKVAEESIQKKAVLYDKDEDGHYDTISAFIKSMRGSDPDAALYWFCRMLEGGEDPLYIARRVVRFASEDVGNADPQALQVAIAAMESYRFLGSPEGELAVAQAIVYCATAPKSNTIYAAYSAARKDARRYGELPVPMHIRNAPTQIMKELGYSKGYKYDHDNEDHYSGQEHLPEELHDRRYYIPTRFGFEKIITERLKWWAKRKKKKQLID